jgi:hypothetical protein
LAFHPYPQLLPCLCNGNRCGPPRGITHASPWPWIAHPVSGLPPATCALFRLAFAPAPQDTCFARRRGELAGSFFNKHAVTQVTPPGSDGLEASGFRVSFTPLPGCFSPFPHGTVRYRSLVVFSLGWWATPLQPGFPVSRPTPDPAPATTPFTYRALTVSGAVFQRPSAGRVSSCRRVVRPVARSTTPPLQRRTASTTTVWALPRSLTTTGGMLSFPRGTEMFQVPRCPS